VELVGAGLGRSQTFSFGGGTGGASFATRVAVNGLCRTFRKRPEKFWEGHCGGQAKFWGEVPPPSSVPGAGAVALNVFRVLSVLGVSQLLKQSGSF